MPLPDRPSKARSRSGADKIRRFFREVGGEPVPGVAAIVVTHLLPDRPFFIEELARIFDPVIVYAKPKSADGRTLAKLDESPLNVLVRTRPRSEFDDGSVIDEITTVVKTSDVVVLDIGGYFSSNLSHLASAIQGRVVGVVEDTENGHRRYERLSDLERAGVSILSVARSPLKDTEDYLVGQAVIHSAEHVIRLAGQILGGKSALVFGFGKIGRSAATNLRSRGVDVKVIDIAPVRQVQALSLGFPTIEKKAGLSQSDLVVGATGSKCLHDDDWLALKPGAIVFTVTSSDDELDLSVLEDPHSPFDLTEPEDAPHVRMYSTDETYFYLLNEGNAVNFLHNAVVGDFIFLVQAEILAAARCLLEQAPLSGGRIGEVRADDRNRIARAWLSHFS